MRKYFTYNGETEVGPYDLEQLKAIQIKSETPIWYEGLQDWTIAENVDELKTIIVLNLLPPKFENFSKQKTSITPPTFNKPENNNYTEKEPKKKNVTGKILLGIGVVAAIFVVGALLISFLTEPSEAEQELINIQDENNFVQDEKTSINIQNTEKNKNYRNNWSDYISVSTNQYDYFDVGGIENLQIIATNKSEYKIDEITVNICYEIDNGTCHKIEELTIYNISANSQKSENAPNSSRGKNVTLNIMEIYSDKMNFAYAAGNWANNSEDPYFTKEKL